MKKARQPLVCFIPLPEGEHSGAIAVAERRATSIIRQWAARPDFDLLSLAVSLYLQGVVDGYTVAEHQICGREE